MLDYKIKELKKQIEPKEEQITDMKDQVKVRATVRCAALRCAVLCCAVLCSAVLCSPSIGQHSLPAGYVLVADFCAAGWGHSTSLAAFHAVLHCAALCWAGLSQAEPRLLYAPLCLPTILSSQSSSSISACCSSQIPQS